MKDDVESFRVSDVTFVGEQDGPAERELKTLLAEVFLGSPTVVRAYLARVLYAPSNAGVALCLNSEAEDRSLVAEIAKRFASLFGRNQHLDIMFISKARETELMRVCPAFFSRSEDAVDRRPSGGLKQKLGDLRESLFGKR
jgi:hypothetical protein